MSDDGAPPPGRVMGIDYGARHVGIALTDPERIIASPLRTLSVSGPDDALKQIATLAKDHDVVEFVVGLPKSLSGDEGPMALEVRTWARELELSTSLRVHLVDERLTSREIERMGGSQRNRKKKRNDHLVASLILQHYLERER